ncbi:MAG: 6,7-dimethyl-8-ribityllumazine synthase [Candidatus Cloacimonetes bacterium]|nr:6,7-dimethyl-8-ribityllumazine synthase [Candidatus Cloacimonadota bacterium]
MIASYAGKLSGKGMRFALLVSRFNEFITSQLLEGALDCLQRQDVAEADLTIVRVPGAFEIPVIAQKLAEKNIYHGIICLGAVIRGDTPHFEYISATVTRGIARVALKFSIPVENGIIMTDNLQQAIERAGTKAGNKGFAAAQNALEMANLMQTLNKI